MTWLSDIWGSIRDTWVYRHEPENLQKIANAYWQTLLIIAVLTFALLVTYSGTKYYELFENGEENPLRSGESGGLLISPDDLRTTLDAFDTRNAQYDSFKKNPPKIVDPSISR